MRTDQIDIDLHLGAGQSVHQGSGKQINGTRSARKRCPYTGLSDPLPGHKNWQQGNSPLLIAFTRGLERGVWRDTQNCCIGGLGILQATGRVNGAVQGNAAFPLQLGYVDAVSASPTYGTYSGSGPALDEGQAGHDPLGVMASIRTVLTQRKQVFKYRAVRVYWLNGETDAGESLSDVKSGYKSFGRSVIGYGADEVFFALSSKPPGKLAAQYDVLQLGMRQAVAELQAEGVPAFMGVDMWAFWGAFAPVCSDDLTHLDDRGTEIMGQLIDQSLAG